MDLDLTIHKGSADKPAVIFIHGLGVDKNMLVDPLQTKIFANNVPVKYLAARRPAASSLKNLKKLTIGMLPEKIDNVWSVMKELGFNLMCWSQARPVGPISSAVDELKNIVRIAGKTFPGKPVALIGHSRGGLIARKYMEDKIPGITSLITISSPHSGSSLAHLHKYLKPLSAAIKVILPKDTQSTAFEILRRFNELIEGNATRELLPDSDFFKELKDHPLEGVKYLSFGATRTQLLTIYRWEQMEKKLYPKPFLIIPDSLLKIFPSSVLPDELISGKGDIMVSAKSSVLPWADEHYNIAANHISILWNKKVINKIVEFLETK